MYDVPSVHPPHLRPSVPPSVLPAPNTPTGEGALGPHGQPLHPPPFLLPLTLQVRKCLALQALTDDPFTPPDSSPFSVSLLPPY